MFHALRDKDQTALGDEMLFIIQPYDELSSQIIYIIRVGSKKRQDFIVIVPVGHCRALRRAFILPFPDPDTLHIKAVLDHRVVKP